MSVTMPAETTNLSGYPPTHLFQWCPFRMLLSDLTFLGKKKDQFLIFFQITSMRSSFFFIISKVCRLRSSIQRNCCPQPIGKYSKLPFRMGQLVDRLQLRHGEFYYININYELQFWLSLILNSTRQLELKAAASLCPVLALAWKISGLPHSSSAMELVERATTLLTSWASGWPLLKNRLSSTGRKVKPSRLEISDPASVAVKSVPRITKKRAPVRSVFSSSFISSILGSFISQLHI